MLNSALTKVKTIDIVVEENETRHVWAWTYHERSPKRRIAWCKSFVGCEDGRRYNSGMRDLRGRRPSIIQTAHVAPATELYEREKELCTWNGPEATVTSQPENVSPNIEFSARSESDPRPLTITDEIGGSKRRQNGALQRFVRWTPPCLAQNL
jgi:hypothetical protein